MAKMSAIDRAIDALEARKVEQEKILDAAIAALIAQRSQPKAPRAPRIRKAKKAEKETV